MFVLKRYNFYFSSPSLLGFCIVFFGLMAANAQSVKDKLFADPSNIEVNLAYLQEQLTNGNLKGAAATLQRVLLIDPDSKLAKVIYAEVQLKLGNRADARLILKELLSDKSLSDEMRGKASFLSDELERSEQRLQISGTSGLGFGSADNALAAPKGPILLFNNGPISNSSPNVSEQFVDFDSVVSLSYKLPTYIERGLSGGLGFAGRDYVDVNMADSLTGFVSLGYAEKNTIPWSATYSAFVTQVSGHSYNSGQQGVFAINSTMPSNMALSANLRLGETRHFVYLGSDAGKQRDNSVVGASLTISKPIRGFLISTSIGTDKSDAEVAFHSADSISTAVNARSRIGIMDVSVGVDFLATEYEAANLLISDKIREDERTRATFTLGFTLPSAFGNVDLSFGGFFADTRSNIPNSTKELSELKIGVRKNF